MDNFYIRGEKKKRKKEQSNKEIHANNKSRRISSEGGRVPWKNDIISLLSMSKMDSLSVCSKVLQKTCQFYMKV